MRARLALGAAVLLLAGAYLALRPTPETPRPTPEVVRPVSSAAPIPALRIEDSDAAGFVDEASCAACHAAEAAAWRDSHHRLAMQPAQAGSVLGDFEEARFGDGASETVFHHDATGYAVETEGPDGERARFEAPYVFGVEPLQQVLLRLPRGRLQALSVAWDTHARRWYSLYPGERIDAHDPLHWTRLPQNWNSSCAECHATDLRRNYDAPTDTYATTWSRLDVGCQACHGPGQRHLAWVRAPDGHASADGHGFDAPLGRPDATREIEACARCHARRAVLADGFDHRHRLLDDYLPALLTEGLYHADGQLLDEVYEYGSFAQSKMHARGVRCSDCHEPHALTLRAPGNLLCTRCHSPAPAEFPRVDLTRLVRGAYDSPEHHHHAPGTPGSACVDCHMPTRTYMGVDARRDHGMRVPRPDLAALTGAPDACSGCHAGRDAAWAAAVIETWNPRRERPAHFGVALSAGRSARAGAAAGLMALARSEEGAIVRATALAELARYPSRAALDVFVAALADPDGAVRHAALAGLELVPPEQRVTVIGASLADPLRAVRAEAGRLLMELGDEALGPLASAAHAALAEYEGVQRAQLERPEAHLNLATLELARGQDARAEEELRAALRLEPAFVPATINLADLVRTRRGEAEGEGLLRTALRRAPDEAALHHALGLALVRQGRGEEGLVALARAAELAPEVARFGYVHAVAQHDLGHADAARASLRALLARHPGERDARFAEAAYLREVGDEDGARRTLAELAAINPFDPGLSAGIDAPPQGR